MLGNLLHKIFLSNNDPALRTANELIATKQNKIGTNLNTFGSNRLVRDAILAEVD